jgi:hypothetical protein
MVLSFLAHMTPDFFSARVRDWSKLPCSAESPASLFFRGGNAQHFFLINALILSNNDVKILVLWAICLITDKDWDDDLTTM